MESLDFWLWATAICPSNLRMTRDIFSLTKIKTRGKKNYLPGEKQKDFLPTQWKQNSLFRRTPWDDDAAAASGATAWIEFLGWKRVRQHWAHRRWGEIVQYLCCRVLNFHLPSSRRGVEENQKRGEEQKDEKTTDSLFPAFTLLPFVWKRCCLYPFPQLPRLFKGFLSRKAC